MLSAYSYIYAKKKKCEIGGTTLEKKPNKFIETIKKKWLINGTKTTILVIALVVIFIGINLLMQKLELAPLDFTKEKLYTLTDESKERVKNVDKDVQIYFVGYGEEDSNLDLAKQYKKTNEHIIAEAVTAETRPDLAQKYGLENGAQGIIVECGEKYKVLSASDLVTYDTSTYETISIAEQKLTTAIISVSSNKIPKVYFLEGYSEFSLTQNMQYLSMLLANEVNEIDQLNILANGKVPDDCDTLVITTPVKDFDDVATNAIIDYINSGRNILWLNSAKTAQIDLPNVNKILAVYGINPFEVGIIRETDSSKMLSGSPDVIMPQVESSDVTKSVYNTTGPIFVNATKINFVDGTKLEELKVTRTDLITASENSYFRTDFNNQAQNKTETEEAGSFTIGAEAKKVIKEANEEQGQKEVVSKLVIYGENYFASDAPLSQNSQYPLVQLGYNKELIMDSISYLVDREEDITARKDTGTVTYTATEQQDIIIRCIIFAVPVLIILIGIIVWQVRRRKK